MFDEKKVYLELLQAMSKKNKLIKKDFSELTNECEARGRWARDLQWLLELSDRYIKNFSKKNGADCDVKQKKYQSACFFNNIYFKKLSKNIILTWCKLNRRNAAVVLEENNEYNEMAYLSFNRDVLDAINANEYFCGFDHWMQFGKKECEEGTRIPGFSSYDEYFDSYLYLKLHPEVGDVAPYKHWREIGLKGYEEGTFIPGFFKYDYFFNEEKYLAKNPQFLELINRGEFNTGYQHWRKVGVQLFEDGKLIPGFFDLDTSFDEKIYLKFNQDVQDYVNQGRFSTGYLHWREFGYDEYKKGERIPGFMPFDEFFNSDLYLKRNAIAAKFVGLGLFNNGYHYWILEGYSIFVRKHEVLGFFPYDSDYNEAKYLSFNPDVKELIRSGAYVSGYHHWVSKGYFEFTEGARIPGFLEFDAVFNEELYKKFNPQIEEEVNKGAYKTFYQHWRENGIGLYRQGLLIPGFLEFDKIFCEQKFFENNADVKAAVENNAYHSGYHYFTKFGFGEILKGTRKSGFLAEEEDFCPLLYYCSNQDVQKLVQNGEYLSSFHHWFRTGFAEYTSGKRSKDSAYKETIFFNKSERPVVSIIIPVYNNWKLTYFCVKSIAESSPTTEFEIIIVNDGSKESCESFRHHVHGVTILTNENNVGFVKSVNRGAEIARGSYLCFLNNDTLVVDDWLDDLVCTFTKKHDAGVVGPQVVYPDYTIQESGNFVSSEGDCIPRGRDKRFDDPLYNYLVEVDYVSACCLLIRKQDFCFVGCFDEMYGRGYYDDPDLCLRVKLNNKRVYCNPTAKIIHFEKVTFKPKENADLCKNNRDLFIHKWQRFLNYTSISTEELVSQNEFSPQKKIMVYIDAELPQPDRGSGGLDAYYFVKYFISKGYNIIYIADYQQKEWPTYSKLTFCLGACHFYPKYSSYEDILSKYGHRVELVFISRVYQYINFIKLIKDKCSLAKIVFNTVDLHHIREKRENELNGENEAVLSDVSKAEIDAIKGSDAAIVISGYEYKYLKTILPDSNNYFHIPLMRRTFNISHTENNNIIFVGSAHPPNVDAVIYFYEKIFPIIRSEIDAKFIIVGQDLLSSLLDSRLSHTLVSDKNVIFTGFLKSLSHIFSVSRISVAPLRYGAGVKGKVATSLSYGVPCVATPIAAEGMGLDPGTDILVGRDEYEFAKYAVNLMTDNLLWRKISNNGLSFIKNNFSVEGGMEKMNIIMRYIRYGVRTYD